MPPTPPPPATTTYRQRSIRCGKHGCKSCAPGAAGHGTYWYAYRYEGGRLHEQYIGKQLPPGVQTPETQRRHRDRAAVSAERPAGPVGAIGPTHPPALRVRTLGAFQVWRGEEPIPAARWNHRKALMLFKVLLNAPEHRLQRDRLMEILWHDLALRRPDGNLRTTLCRLRKVLDAPGVRESYLRWDTEVLELVPAPGGQPASDWWDATAFVREAATALVTADAAACRAALGRYSGDYMPEHLDEPWATSRRGQVHEQRRALLWHLARSAVRQRQESEAIEHLRAAVDLDPGDEPMVEVLMLLLYEVGRRAEAVRVYQQLREALRRELDMAPEEHMRRLCENIRAGEQDCPQPGAAARGSGASSDPPWSLHTA